MGTEARQVQDPLTGANTMSLFDKIKDFVSPPLPPIEPPKPEPIPLVMIGVGASLRRLELYVLDTLGGYEGGEYLAYYFQAFGELDRELARGVLRSLAARGYAQYTKGLWADDGLPAGSGYAITDKGRAYRADLLLRRVHLLGSAAEDVND